MLPLAYFELEMSTFLNIWFSNTISMLEVFNRKCHSKTPRFIDTQIYNFIQKMWKKILISKRERIGGLYACCAVYFLFHVSVFCKLLCAFFSYTLFRSAFFSTCIVYSMQRKLFVVCTYDIKCSKNDYISIHSCLFQKKYKIKWNHIFISSKFQLYDEPEINVKETK